MIAEKILNAIFAIDAMAHEFTSEQWERIRLIREELKDAHVMASEMEKRIPINVAIPTPYLEAVSHG